MLTKTTKLKASRKATVAATPQVDFIGYNTTSGAIETSNNAVYRATIAIKEVLETNHQQVYIKDMVYKSDASATQAEIADGLIASGIANFSREAEKMVTFERVTSSTVTPATTDDITAVNGSKFVSAATDIDAGGALVGDYLVLQDVPYKIVVQK